ncbi:MAG: MerR family transcriptional regulator [Rikenellaceae bacterium]
MKSKKLFYTMGEVVEIFDVSPALIRYWESQFDVIKPERNKKGNRLFTPADLENFKIIYSLIRERKMTIEGAKIAMKKGTMIDGSSLDRDTQILERLHALRDMLVEIRTMMKEGQEPISTITEEEINEVVIEEIVEQIEEKNTNDEVAKSEAPTRTRQRRPSEPYVKEGELFRFYEQRLPLTTDEDDIYR